MPLLPKPVTETESTLRAFLGLDIVLTALAVLFRVGMLNYPVVSDPVLLNIATMAPIVIMGSVVILITALIQHERAEAKKSD